MLQILETNETIMANFSSAPCISKLTTAAATNLSQRLLYRYVPCDVYNCGYQLFVLGAADADVNVLRGVVAAVGGGGIDTAGLNVSAG